MTYFLDKINKFLLNHDFKKKELLFFVILFLLNILIIFIYSDFERDDSNYVLPALNLLQDGYPGFYVSKEKFILYTNLPLSLYIYYVYFYVLDIFAIDVQNYHIIKLLNYICLIATVFIVKLNLDYKFNNSNNRFILFLLAISICPFYYDVLNVSRGEIHGVLILVISLLLLNFNKIKLFYFCFNLIILIHPNFWPIFIFVNIYFFINYVLKDIKLLFLVLLSNSIILSFFFYWITIEPYGLKMLIDNIIYNANDKSFLTAIIQIYENITFKRNFSFFGNLFYFIQFSFFVILLLINLIIFFKNLNFKNLYTYISLSIFFILFFSKASAQTYTILTFLMSYNFSLNSNLLSKKS